MNVLEALRGLMQQTAEGYRMQALGPDFRERQAESAQKLTESRERIRSGRRREEREGRQDARQALLDENAFAEQLMKIRSLIDSPQAEMPKGLAGPPEPVTAEPIEFVGPGGQRVPVDAPFRDELATRARGEADIDSARRIAERMQIATETNDLPLGAGDRERIALTEAGANRRAAISASAAAQRRNSMTPQQTFRNTMDLSKQYMANTKAARLVDTQFGVMENALANWDKTAAGLAPTTEVVVTTFNKIMDPGSVVRESEYARSTRGQSLLRDIEGRAKALQRGGPGLTPETLADYVRLARVFRDEYQETLAAEQQRVTALADSAGLDPNLIMGARDQPSAQKPATHRYNPQTRRIEAIR